MRIWTAAALLATGLAAGCMAAGPLSTAQPVPPEAPAEARTAPTARSVPLVLDRTDLSLGVTVQYSRLPTAEELSDLRLTAGLVRIVLALPEWPTDYEPLMVLNQLPPQTDVLVVLPGYPPSRAAAEAWNLVGARPRLVLVVDRPPPSLAVVQDLNGMRGLERLIADVDPPSRAGFERLQRPLSFRRLVD